MIEDPVVIGEMRQAADQVDYALTLAIARLRNRFEDKDIKVSDCVTFAAAIIARVNKMNDCDIGYLEMDRADRRVSACCKCVGAKK